MSNRKSCVVIQILIIVFVCRHSAFRYIYMEFIMGIFLVNITANQAIAHNRTGVIIGRYAIPQQIMLFQKSRPINRLRRYFFFVLPIFL